ncbi:hypothetical protein ALC53_02634 [Atta colombica]|uniref:Uncharacterized protein n=1 Tax=Atta colombica TaxID=520822 RepID=A0A195BQJ7_9HYME|nr:hypothetical protein ALC53_02634 [Atta colombica]
MHISHPTPYVSQNVSQIILTWHNFARTRIGSNCTTDEDCKVVENAICDPAETYRCDRAHFASDTDTECIPGNINVADTILQMMIFEQLCRQKLWLHLKIIANILSTKTFPRLSVIRAPQTNEGMRKVTRQPDGQPIETRPGFFLYKMGQNLLTRIGSDATTKIVGTEFQVSPQLSS